MSARDLHLERSQLYPVLHSFYNSYCIPTPISEDYEHQKKMFFLLCEEILKQKISPHSFSIFHRAVRHPFDYYQFGLDFIRPFIDPNKSLLLGEENLTAIEKQLNDRQNVILFANHQTEPDPQIISLLIEKNHPKLASEMIFVAGHRVISDPVAIPMSLGRNLLCIYSKKYLNYPPEEKAQKMSHNQKTLKKMQELLNEGGHCIFVAPSGGRDRRNAQGEIEIAPFDPQSIELFYLMGQQAEHKTHFYPLSLCTYHLMPPPQRIEKKLGEQRVIRFTPVYAYFGPEIDMENISDQDEGKKAFRAKRAKMIWEKVHHQTLTFKSA